MCLCQYVHKHVAGAHRGQRTEIPGSGVIGSSESESPSVHAEKEGEVLSTSEPSLQPQAGFKQVCLGQMLCSIKEKKQETIAHAINCSDGQFNT